MAKQVSKSAIVTQLMSDPEIVALLKSALGSEAPKPKVEWSIERADAKDGTKGVSLRFGANRKSRWMYLDELDFVTKPEMVKHIREFLAKQ